MCKQLPKKQPIGPGVSKPTYAGGLGIRNEMDDGMDA